MPSPTYCGYALLRSNLKSGNDADIAEAVAYGKRVKFYPLVDDEEAETTFVDASGVVFDATIPYDATFFDALDRRVQAEPLLTRDKAMIDTLKTIGIEKGHPFAPDTATTNTLTDAMTEAHAWFDVRYQAVFDTTFYDDAKWAFPGSRDLVEASESGFSNPDIYPIDDRGVTYSWAFFSAKKMGAGQYYLMTIQDEDGKAFDGGAAIPTPGTPRGARHAVLVGHRLRPHHAHPPPGRAQSQSLVEQSRLAHRGRRIGRRLLRTRTSRRVRRELGPDPQGRPLRGALPLLRTPEALLRQNVETPRHRTGSLNRRQPRTASPSAGLGVESGTGARQPPRFVASLWLVEGVA